MKPLVASRLRAGLLAGAAALSAAVGLVAATSPTFAALVDGAPGDGRTAMLSEFDGTGFTYVYGTFQKNVTSSPQAVTIGGPNVKAKGGAGVIANANLAGFEQASPVLRLRVLDGNKAGEIAVSFQDQDGTSHGFRYDLPDTGTAFQVLWPKGGANLTTPFKVEKPGDVEGLDLSQLKQWQIQGTWTDQPIHVQIDRFELRTDVPAEIAAEREALATKLAQEKAKREREASERAERMAKMLEQGVPADPNGPEVTRAFPVGDDMIAVEIVEGTISPRPQRPYEPQPKDNIRESGKPVWVYLDGELKQEPKGFNVRREGEDIGALVRHLNILTPGFAKQERRVNHEVLGEPRAYRIVSEDDSNFGTPKQPAAVHVKRRNSGHDGDAPVTTVFLQMPEPLKPGAVYVIDFYGLNTQQPTFSYTHNPATSVSDAVQVSQVGFRPSDPYKVGHLSLWLGTGGEHAFDAETFEVIDEAGNAVFTGPVELANAADARESFKDGRNYARTNVYKLDFSGFEKPGSYRLRVPGVGTSRTFAIREDAWAEAFKVSMMGLLHHRSGIELGAPFTTYQRPRNMHPDDGLKVFPVPGTMLEGEVKVIAAGAKHHHEAGKLPEPIADAWGGYMDAGDWDRRTKHLAGGRSGTYILLELFELYPDYFQGVALNLPPEESSNDLPDLLDEALFNIDFYLRLQQPDGGVRGGIESSEHPRSGEASWQESLFVGAFAPDPVSSYLFAANATKAARLLEEYDAARASTLHQAAVRAFDWAQNNTLNHKNESGARAQAGVELYRTTGEERYHEAFKADSMLFGNAGDTLGQEDLLFAYARLPEGLGDAAAKQRARELLLEAADKAIAFQRGNSYGLATPEPNLPPMGWVSYFGTPGMVSRILPRAYVLTGDERYLAATLASTNFAVGANPNNLVYTTGLGQNPVRFPLHIDSNVSGQPAPAGITVYGQSDPAENYDFESWVHTWKLADTIPNSRTWPAYEAYHDIYVSPSMNEYTVHQTIMPTAYTWGILAARDAE